MILLRILWFIYAVCTENCKGQPMPPSRQIWAQWVVKAWDAVSEKSIQKAWTVFSYKSMEILIDVPNSMNEISIVCAQNDVEIVQEYLTDNDEHHHFLDPENGEQNIVLSSVLN